MEIHQIIQIEEVHGGCRFIDQVLGKIKNIRVTKVMDYMGVSLMEKQTEKTLKRWS